MTDATNWADTEASSERMSIPVDRYANCDVQAELAADIERPTRPVGSFTPITPDPWQANLDRMNAAADARHLARALTRGTRA